MTAPVSSLPGAPLAAPGPSKARKGDVAQADGSFASLLATLAVTGQAAPLSAPLPDGQVVSLVELSGLFSSQEPLLVAGGVGNPAATPLGLDLFTENQVASLFGEALLQVQEEGDQATTAELPAGPNAPLINQLPTPVAEIQLPASESGEATPQTESAMPQATPLTALGQEPEGVEAMGSLQLQRAKVESTQPASQNQVDPMLDALQVEVESAQQLTALASGASFGSDQQGEQAPSPHLAPAPVESPESAPLTAIPLGEQQVEQTAPSSNEAGSLTRLTGRYTPQQFVEELTQAVSKAADGEYNVTLKLHPEHLGEVRLQLQLSGRAVYAALEVVSSDARQLLENRSEQLRESLDQAGFSLTGFEVSTGHRRQARDQWESFGQSGRGSASQTEPIGSQRAEAIQRIRQAGTRSGRLDTMA